MACSGKMFEIVPDKFNKDHIRLSSAWNGVDSYNVQFNAEFAECEVVLYHIPDEIGF